MLKNNNDEQIINFAFIGQCVKGVAHNINTPLSAIMGRSEMLQMRLNRIKEAGTLSLSADEMDKCLRDVNLILENSMRVSDTVKNAMQKSIHAENPSPQKINIANILKEELSFYTADMDFKHNLEKEYSIADKVPALEGVYVDFSNSFIEILENAKNAMMEVDDKKLSVSLSHTGSVIEFSVEDSGCGFDDMLKTDVLTLLRSNGAEMPDSLSRGGFARVARLLKNYHPKYDIQSQPGKTKVTIQFPV